MQITDPVWRLDQGASDVVTWGYPYPDLSWSFVDALGREHRWRHTGVDDSGFPKAELGPLIVWKVDDLIYCSETDEHVEYGHYEVGDTGEMVKPGLLHTGELRRHVAGAKSVECDFYSSERLEPGAEVPLSELGLNNAGIVVVTLCRSDPSGLWAVSGVAKGLA